MPLEEGEIELIEAAAQLPPARIRDLLRAGICHMDRAFERYLPLDIQRLSNCHWTPLVVARVAARWLDEVGAKTVVDIGSGPGKFCVAAALASRCEFLGLEHRGRLIHAARELAAVFEVPERVHFVEGRLGDVELPQADALYLFNPFGENLYGCDDWIDSEVELSDERYERDVAHVERMLRTAPVGSFLLTYNGFGGRIPWHYSEVRVDRALPSVLRLWQRIRGPGEVGSHAA